MQKIGILTGGGDCPGLNGAIKAVTKKALAHGFEVIGIRDGWRGLLSPELTMSLDAAVVRHIDRQGGTILGTSRTNPFKKDDGVSKIKASWKQLGLDALVAIGGEDTLGVANKLWNQEKLAIVGVPKTIDRDLGGTEYSLGFESALQVITDSVDALRSTAESHSRVFVVEVMGRHAGHLALRGGISAGASLILIPEVPFDVGLVCKKLDERRSRGIRYSIVMVAEGALPKGGQEALITGEKDAFGHVRLGGIGQWLSDEIQKRSQIETRHVVLSHLQRGGQPVAYDRRLGFYLGTAAVEAILLKKFGMMSALKNGKICLLALQEATAQLQLVNVDRFYDVEHYGPRRDILIWS